MARDHRASAFTYGRQKLDVLLDSTLRELPAGGRVLDVGCGTGEQLRRCRQLGFKVTGIEPSARMRSIARRLNPGVLIQDGSITSIPFQNESFDCVLAIEVLRYLHPVDIRQAYREMLRVLKPNGRCFFTMVNRYALDGFYLFDALKRRRLRLSQQEEPAHCEFVTPGQVRRDLAGLGVTDINIQGRMLAPLRIAYKVNATLGAQAARRLERFDDLVSGRPWMAPFAGHLVVVATRPARSLASGVS